MNLFIFLLFLGKTTSFFKNENINIHTNLHFIDKKKICQIESKIVIKKNYNPYKSSSIMKYNIDKRKNIYKNIFNSFTKINELEELEELEESIVYNKFINRKLFNEENEDNMNKEENENENEEDDIEIKDFREYEDEDFTKKYEKETISRKKKMAEFYEKYNQRENKNERKDDFVTENGFEVIKTSNFTFKDIGGYEKIKDELMQVADILKNYTKYEKYNVRTPKGLILEGPPGNGKTLLAKCFSGELNSSFIAVSGSEFIEKYVGVGASRIRDLFKLAEKNKPCIIFIDEIDSVGRQRGNELTGTNSEKDQTLNQLLVNMDGYKSLSGIFIIGATNRIDLLDVALLRPGRIDKKIYIGNPDKKTRKDIIEIHIKGKPCENDIKIDDMVRITSGFSGAQIENILNEAMLYALRENREKICLHDLEFVNNRMIAGWQSTESQFSDDIIDRIVIHEMGHAIVGLLSKEHSKLSKVCINLSSPQSPGYTIFENEDENINIYTKQQLLSHLEVLIAGRVAEEVFFGESVTTGAKKDLEQLLTLTKQMIIEYGMGTKPIYMHLSEYSKQEIDKEINDIIDNAHKNAYRIIKSNKKIIIECSALLKEKKILRCDEIEEIRKKNKWDCYNE
jgi:cell division protease FtsH